MSRAGGQIYPGEIVAPRGAEADAAPWMMPCGCSASATCEAHYTVDAHAEARTGVMRAAIWTANDGGLVYGWVPSLPAPDYHPIGWPGPPTEAALQEAATRQEQMRYVARWMARQRAAELRIQENRRLLSPAEEASATTRSLALMGRYLTPDQITDWNKRGAFVVTAQSGALYHVGVTGVYSEDYANYFCLSVFDTDGNNLPIADVVLARKLLLEVDEKRFLTTANMTVCNSTHRAFNQDMRALAMNTAGLTIAELRRAEETLAEAEAERACILRRMKIRLAILMTVAVLCVAHLLWNILPLPPAQVGMVEIPAGQVTCAIGAAASTATVGSTAVTYAIAAPSPHNAGDLVGDGIEHKVGDCVPVMRGTIKQWEGGDIICADGNVWRYVYQWNYVSVR